MSDEKIPEVIDVQTSNEDSSKNVDSQSAEVDHLELKHHTSADIASSGHWYDRRYFGIRYSSAMTQIVVLAFVIFMTPGMFNALSGIGASISSRSTSDNANVALYSTFASVGFFGGTICNTIGVRASLMFGGTGYALYAASLLCFAHTENSGFVIFAGAFLGVCAAVLWSAQGTIIISYPTENRKGTAIMVFWVIFNLGAVIGSIIPLANNLENKGSTANDGTYIAFIVLMCIGTCIAYFMLPVSKVWKADGTRVMTQKHPDWKEELKGLVKLLIKEPVIFTLFPMFFASNWFYTYQFNDFNAGRFNLRTRSLNSLLYWFAQMLGAIALGTVLDINRLKRSTRARVGWCIVFVVGMAIWGGGYAFQKTFTRESVAVSPDHPHPTMAPMDYKDSDYIGPMFLYMFYGVHDAMFQTFILWSLGALSNNPKKAALYAGFYKGIQSAGAAVAWSLDSNNASFMNMLISSWVLIIGSLLVAAPLILFRIKDHTAIEDDDMENILDESELKSIKSAVPSKHAV